MVAVARLELQRRHEAVALGGTHVRADFHAVGREVAGRDARIVRAAVRLAAGAVDRAAAARRIPRLVRAETARRQRRVEVRIAEGEAERRP